MGTLHHSTASNTPEPTARRAGLLWRGLIFALLWLMLTQGSWHSWIIGLIVVPAATWCAIALFPPQSQSQALEAHAETGRLQLLAVPGFIPFFLYQSLYGGWITAQFALNPRKPLNPGFIRFHTRLPPGRAQLVFLHMTSLLPGTVSADWRDDQIIVHALDTSTDNLHALELCEQQTARLFGLQLPAPPSPPNKGANG